MSSQMPKTRRRWRSKLLVALDTGDLAAFTLILSSASNSGQSFDQPFWHACLETASRREGGHVFVKTLLRAGVKPRRTTAYTEPIHSSCEKGHDQNLKALLENHRTDVNATDGSGRTALHHLARNFDERRPGYSKCLALLLSRADCDVNRPSHKGFTALHEAANRGSTIFVRTVLAGPLRLDLDEHFAFGRTTRDAISQHLPSLSFLLPPVRRRVLDVSSDEAQVLLLHALRKRKLKDFVSLLYQVDDDLNTVVSPDHLYGDPNHTTCLHEASKKTGSDEYIKYLLRVRADPNVANQTDGKVALHYAVETANLTAIKLLVQYERTDINAADFEGETALHCAVKSIASSENREECLRLILQHQSIDVNRKDALGHTATLQAVMKGDERILRLLLSHSPNLETYSQSSNKTVKDIVKDKFPHLSDYINELTSTATDKLSVKDQLIQYLMNNDQKSFLKAFKHHVKSDKDMLDFKVGEKTILQYSCRRGMVDIVKALLKYGADPNLIKYENHKPPLILAVVHQQKDVVSYLIKIHKEIGVNINAIDEIGNTALHYADLNEDLQTVTELLRHGANISVRNSYGNLCLQARTIEKVLNFSITSSEHHPHDTDYRLDFDFSPIINYSNEVTFCSSPEDEVWLRIDSEIEHCDIMKCNQKKESEMDFFDMLSSCNEYQDLLLHPAIELFLNIKWNRLRIVFYVIMILYSLFVGLLFTYILMCDMKNDRISKSYIDDTKSENNLTMADNGQMTEEWSGPKAVFMSILFLFLFLATMFDTAVTMYKIPLRLIKPCMISFGPGPTRRVLRFSRIMDISVNIFTSVFLYKIKGDSIQEVSAVIVILCSCTKLTLMFANFPKKFSNVKVVEYVLDRYAICFLQYCILIIGFAFSFHILLKDDEYFGSPWTSVFKTATMMTGYIGIESEMFVLNPGVSHIVFLLFIIFLFVVAISILSVLFDSAEQVRKEAHILKIQDHVELISEIESFLLRMRKIKIFRKCFGRIKYVNDWFGNVSVFQDDSNKIITIFPNRPKHIECYGCNLPDGGQIIKSAIKVVKNSHDFSCSSDTNHLKNALEKQYHMLQELSVNYHLIQKFINEATEYN